MVAIISMAQLDPCNSSEGDTGLKRRFERLTGSPATSLHCTQASPEYIAGIGPQAIFITGFAHGWRRRNWRR